LKQLKALDINLKVINKIITNLKSSSVYFKEIIIVYLILVIITYIKDNDPASALFIIIAISILFSFLFYYIGDRRRREIAKIKSVIADIRNSRLNVPEEILLENNLSGLQEEIRDMFSKMKSDIEYLKKLERVRKEFLANVSHELRTPIFTIQGYIETLLDGAINDQKVNKSFLEKANYHTINLSTLLNDLIDISMIESGEMRLSFRYFNIIEFIKKQVEEMIPVADKKNITILFKPEKDKLEVFGDRDKLRQVFVNLIQNSIKYTETGSLEIEIIDEGNLCKIIIRDTGIGIPEEDLNRIFERFYRVDKARSRAVGGTGLGLAIVKHIIEAHNSKIEVKSRLNEGTEFSFHLKK